METTVFECVVYRAIKFVVQHLWTNGFIEHRKYGYFHQ